MYLTEQNKLRTLKFLPYVEGKGHPYFRLETFADGSMDTRGCEQVGYKFYQIETGPDKRSQTLLFSGSDFYGCPSDATDSDSSMAALLTFLSLRPGDTDLEYFEGYTGAQLDFCAQHAEVLSMEALELSGEL